MHALSSYRAQSRFRGEYEIEFATTFVNPMGVMYEYRVDRMFFLTLGRYMAAFPKHEYKRGTILVIMIVRSSIIKG